MGLADRGGDEGEGSFSTVPGAGGLQLLRADFTEHVFPRHYQETYVIGVHDAGGEEFYCRGARHVSLAGSVILLNPGEVHSGRSAGGGPWLYRGMYPDEKFLQGVATQVAGRGQPAPFFSSPVVHDPRLARSLLRLHRSLHNPGCALEAQTRLLLALSRLVVRHADAGIPLTPEGREARAVGLAREYIEAHYERGLTLEELARVAGLNPFYLVRVFRRQTGLPPHEYLNQVRLGRAKRLLAGGTPIARVAAETGFVDQSHFTRRFKSVVGVTPKVFARGSIPYKTSAASLP